MHNRAQVWGGALSALLLVAPSAAPGQAARTVPAPSSAETTLLQALAADPVTAPYSFRTRVDRGRVVLMGRVGTKAVYDVAVRIAIATGIPFTDRLVIDTNEVTRVPAPVAAGMGGVAAPRAVPLSGVPPYVYPEPLFGYYDDPFYGFEPPLFSFPPWWQPRVEGSAAAAMPAGPAQGGAANGVAEGTVELAIDPLGYGLLRGTVATQEEKDGIAAKAAKLPGLRGIINRIEVAPEPGAGGRRLPTAPQPVDPGEAGAAAEDDQPPPPPRPFDPARDGPAAGNVPAPPAPGVSSRVADALGREAGTIGDEVQVSAVGDVVTLSGRVRSAYEAMRAFRVAQETPGVARIVDRLEFPLPTSARDNPLLDRVDRADLEPYLQFQLARQVGDQAQIDGVEARGRTLEVTGTLRNAADRPRIEAILRSAPLLRGFQVHLNLAGR